ncbi:MAG: PAS domain S-box protein [Bacteroidales bacterium]
MKLNIFKTGYLKLSIAIIIAIPLIILLIYYQNNLQKQLNARAELILFETGKEYEFEINVELEKFSAVAEILSTELSKNFENDNFKSETRKLFQKILLSHQRLQSITLVLNQTNNIRDSIENLFLFKDSLTNNIIRFKKNSAGVTEDVTSPEFKSLASEIIIKKVSESEQVKISSPEMEKIDGRDVPVIPIIAALYGGKKYLGYLVLHVSLNWLNNNKLNEEGLDNNIETFVSAGKGQVFAMNKNTDLISEPIQKVCIPCQELLAEKGSHYNTKRENGVLTLCFRAEFNNSRDIWNICMRSKDKFLLQSLNYNPYLIWFVTIIVYLAVILLIFFYLKKHDHFWSDLHKISSEIEKGNPVLNETITSTDLKTNEGKLKASLLKVSGLYNYLISNSKSVKEGSYSIENDNEFLNNKLVQSTKEVFMEILDLRTKVANSTEHLAKITEFNEGQEKISKMLQLHYHDLKALSENVIRQLVDLLKISMGAVFLTDYEQDEPVLEMAVSYAYSETRYQKRKFRFGESLVGACAAEQRTIYIKKIPENYLAIMSGLGLAPPKSILIIPIIFESKVLGVIELGSLDEFTEFQVSFAEKAASTIAGTLSLTRNNIINSELLEKTRQQTLELEERDKKTKEALNQLSELHAKTARSEASVRSKLEAMNNTLMIVEYTTNGTLLDANYKFLNTMHYSIEEIKGNNVLDLLKDDEREELVKIIENVKQGNFFEGLVKRHTKLGHEKWFLATYTPVYNEEGQVESILFFAVDVTRIKTREELLAKKSSELTNQVNELRNLLNK